MSDKRKKSREETEKFVHMVAEHNGWALNPDRQFLDTLIDGLNVNFNRYGFYQCPCRDSWGDREKDSDIACPCVYNVPDQKEHGHCFCGLFLTREFADSGRTPGQIPERRPPEKYPD
ncbi:ferredoxin-thioredoxin reductase catalytic domain-containing protein [Salinispira pacifica]